MTIAITGVNGFIGQHLASRLISKGYKISGLAQEEKPTIELNSYIEGSVLENNKVEELLKDADMVIHLAAITFHDELVSKKEKSEEINLTGTRNVLDAFVKSRAKKFIYPSTGKVYGKIKYLPIDENHPTSPQNVLGKLKLKVEELIKSYETPDKQLVIFRIFNVYGSGQNSNFLIPTILKQLFKANEITLGDIEAKRDYIYIDDVIDVFVLAIEQKTFPGIHIYNICTGISKSALDIVRLIGKIKKINIKININPDLIRKDESPEEYGSFELAKKELEWFPKTNLEKGLRIICKQ